MKLLSILFIAFTATTSFAQYNEFKINSNGLIYTEATMNQLGTIVDSLNLKFRSCDLSHPYYSVPQGFAHYVDIKGKEVRKLMEAGLSFEEFEKKYPRNVKKKNVWVTKSEYTNYKDIAYIEYESLPGKHQLSISVKDKKSNHKTSGWLISDDGTEAFYLLSLQSIELPYDYARLVQYVDCMIDTTATIFFAGAKGEVYEQVAENSKAHDFIKWAESFPGRPEYPDYDKVENFDSAYEVFQSKFHVWDSLRLLHVDDLMQTSRYWKGVLTDARDEAFESRNSDPRLEFYVGRYLSSADALKLMRGRKVIGGCSQDQSPRYHAMNICRLAAETAQWDIFLRSHLDIMNDRFERVSDGSYAYAGRKTYLKELEELDIPAIDLLLGTTLRVENVSDNHYFGSINRTGRALADTADKAALEKRLIAMMSDPALDPYNRVLLTYLFDNYAYNLDDETQKGAALATLNKVIATMPEYMREVLKRD
ncbi:MAG TPA: hypothetical protein VFU05_16220 [Cyclobacteriaceae bacterium]|nr:hypothetical protein [Cyclobacteriaceae bacterium]